MFWSCYTWGHRLSTNLTGSWVGHRACLSAVAKNKNTTPVRKQTCLPTSDNLLAQVSKQATRYKINWSARFLLLVIPLPVSVEVATFVCTLILKPIHILASMPQSSNLTYHESLLSVKYHQETWNLSFLSVFIKFRDLLTVLTYMKSYLSKHWNFTLKPISCVSIKFGIESLHWSYVHYISVRTSSAEPLLYIWS
jgi:hypothetical protein